MRVILRLLPCLINWSAPDVLGEPPPSGTPVRAISEAVGPLACRRAAGPAGGFRRSSLSDDRAPHPRSRVPPAQPRSHCPPPGRPHPPIHRHSSGGSDPTPPPPRPRPPAQRSDLRSALRHPDDEPRSSPPQRLRRSSRDPMPHYSADARAQPLRSAFRHPENEPHSSPPTHSGEAPRTRCPAAQADAPDAAPLVRVPPSATPADEPRSSPSTYSGGGSLDPMPRYSGRGLGAVRLVSRVSSRSKSAGSSNPL